MRFCPKVTIFEPLLARSSFILPVTSNKGSNQGQISFCPINSKKESISNPIMYLLKAGDRGILLISLIKTESEN